jgi:acetyl-CoA C-acetyltransferase
MTPVNEHWGTSLRALAAEAAQKALEDAGVTTVEALYVGNAYGSTFNFQSQIGALVADYLGLQGIEAFTAEAGDASGGAALRMAHLAVASGAVNSALVVGVEKATDIVGSERVKARTVSLDADYETPHGATLSSLAALLMRRYMHEYGVDLSAFEGFSINAHANGQRNEYAMYRNSIKSGAFAKAPMVSDPVSLFDSAPDGDGAAAVLIIPAEQAIDRHPHPIYITGSAVATDHFMLQERPDPLHFKAAALSAQKALAQAQLTLNDLHLLELHDAYTVMTALALEALGYAERGRGYQLAAEISLQGRIPISTFGGLKSRGHAAGATGIYQAVEATLQLRQQADKNQVANAQTALIQNLGGVATTAITHILQAS